MAANSLITVRSERFGRTMLRLAAAATLVLLVLGATIGAVGAEPIVVTGVNLSKDEFIKACLDGPGINIVTEYPTGSVVCEHDDGSSTVCNFNTKICVTILPAGQTPTTHGTVRGGTATTGGTISGGSGTTGVRSQVAKPGTILLLDDDDAR